MQDVLIKIFIAIGVLFFIIAVVSIFRYSYGVPVTKKAIYVSSVYMLLGMLALVVVIYLTVPAMTLLALLGGVGATGFHLISGLVTLAMREKILDWLDLWLGRK